MEYILGIDQGSTKTAAIVSDTQGNILGSGKSSGACHSINGMDYAMEMVKSAVLEAIGQSSIELEQVEKVYAGMTGADWSHEYELLRKALYKTLQIEEIKVFNDSLIALWGGANKPFGVVLCAGTGLNAAVRSTEGEEFIFGYLIEDMHHGGEALGKKAVHLAASCNTGLPQSQKLTEQALVFFKVASPEELLFKYINGQIDGTCVRAFVPHLFNAAFEGDKAAYTILLEFAYGISRYAIAGLRKFNLLDIQTEVILSGSIFRDKNPLFRDIVTAEIVKHAPKAEVKNAKYEPVVGAIVYALTQIYGSILQDISINIYNSCTRYGLIRLN